MRTPTLLVGGDADPLWDGAVARRVESPRTQVVEVPGGDHNLEVAGDERKSLRVLGDVVARMSAFVDQLPPPGPARSTVT